MVNAAGGILLRETAGGIEVAVIHRPRYGDWSLPKGKLKKGESPEEAAVREVQEETGCAGRIVGPAGTTRYKQGDKPKVVHFFRMRLEEEGVFEPSEEVDKVVWLPPGGAIERLDYRAERELLQRLFRATPSSLHSP
jgi:8-oxo-dGTP pyrophosphatase MutT (NUDIX family)